jgi:hypothetical protein
LDFVEDRDLIAQKSEPADAVDQVFSRLGERKTDDVIQGCGPNVRSIPMF